MVKNQLIRNFQNVLFLLSFLMPGVFSVCDDGSEYLSEHPFGGRCVCDGQLWVSEMCREGFWCIGTTGEGCYKTCPEGYFLITHIDYNYWECVEEGVGSTDSPVLEEVSEMVPINLDMVPEGKKITTCPVEGGYHICPSNNAPQPPVETPTENPLGNCRCNGEIWVSEGCKYAWRCQSGAGDYFSCPNEGEFIHFDTDTKEITCSSVPGNCYGGAIEGIGCPSPICKFYNNPYGECGCEGQFFINDDCTAGFLCTEKIPDPFQYDGCFKECLDNQVLIPDWGGHTWRCIDYDSAKFKCPGKFNLYCPDEDIGNNFDESMCECDGQLLVSSDCRDSFYCLNRLPGGGAKLSCQEDEIVDVDFETFDYACSKQVENCPANMGGFKFGCEGSNIPIAPPTCNFTTENTIGDCRCSGQIMVSEDCQRSIYCTTLSTNPDHVGCELNCPVGERVHVDMKTKEWNCLPRDDNFVCPGRFEVDCPDDNKEIQCECKNQVWLEEDCSGLFLCLDEQNVPGVNIGSSLTCPNNTLMHVKFQRPVSYTCEGPSTGYTCPGAYHFGCEGGDFGELTTSTVIPTTTTTKEGSVDTTTTTQGGGATSTSTTTPTTTESGGSTSAPTTQPGGNSGLALGSKLALISFAFTLVAIL